jgi:predicted XRE-type DNA-binding protein
MEHTKGEIRVVHEINLEFEHDRCGLNGSHRSHNERKANAERIAALWNAAPEDIDQAVKYLKYGAKMVEEIGSMLAWLEPQLKGHSVAQVLEVSQDDISRLKSLLAKLEDNNV